MTDLNGEPDQPNPLDQLRFRIKRLHREHGEPSTRVLAQRTQVISHSTVHSVLRCEKLPNYGHLEVVVMALAGDGDIVKEFQKLWVAARDFEDPPNRSASEQEATDPAAELDQELAGKRQARAVPNSKAARELDAETSAWVTGLTGQLEYAARLVVGAWDGKLDQRGKEHWEWASYVAEKAENAERAAREIVRSIHVAKGWPVPEEPKKALDKTGYGEGDQPAIRRARDQSDGYLAYPCYFCGTQMLRRSYGDREQDPFRVELYCDNPDCEAREIIVLVRRGLGTHLRADVRALRDLDDSGEPRDAPPQPQKDAMGDLRFDPSVRFPRMRSTNEPPQTLSTLGSGRLSAATPQARAVVLHNPGCGGTQFVAVRDYQVTVGNYGDQPIFKVQSCLWFPVDDVMLPHPNNPKPLPVLKADDQHLLTWNLKDLPVAWPFGMPSDELPSLFELQVDFTDRDGTHWLIELDKEPRRID
ncbi:hypothetical protein ACNTMW_30865 [Planosporangium sp. 12N6]|uniref:hypothetical protein n=1 Tax=Planosporangium spinosum TaxID=3402278 RepID=UPI003CF558C2